MLAACSSAPARDGVKVVRYDVRSRFVHRTLAQTAVLPPGGGEGRPLLVFLHGRGGRRQRVQRRRRRSRRAARLGSARAGRRVPQRRRPLLLARPPPGDWARYVLDEVIPRAIRRCTPTRIAWRSAGSRWAASARFDIARQRPRRFCAVGGHSAALWRRRRDRAGRVRRRRGLRPQRRHPPRRARGRAPGARARCGSTAAPTTRSGRPTSGSPRRCTIPMRHWPGGHDGGYWQRPLRALPALLRRRARALLSGSVRRRMADEEVPVLIVGGSLVGLTTAMLLGYHGVPSLSVERHAGTAIHPRAGHFQLRHDGDAAPGRARGAGAREVAGDVQRDGRHRRGRVARRPRARHLRQGAQRGRRGVQPDACASSSTRTCSSRSCASARSSSGRRCATAPRPSRSNRTTTA